MGSPSSRRPRATWAPARRCRCRCCAATSTWTKPRHGGLRPLLRSRSRRRGGAAHRPCAVHGGLRGGGLRRRRRPLPADLALAGLRQRRRPARHRGEPREALALAGARRGHPGPRGSAGAPGGGGPGALGGGGGGGGGLGGEPHAALPAQVVVPAWPGGGVSSLSADLIAAARRIGEALRPPPVARVLLPAAEPGPEGRGEFCAVQLGDGSAGLAYVLLGDARERLAAIPAASLAGEDAAALARGLRGDDAAGRSLGLAALNALTRHLYQRAGFAPDLARDSLGDLALGPDDRLGMVGFFPPLVRRALEAGTSLLVLELKAELVQEIGRASCRERV